MATLPSSGWKWYHWFSANRIRTWSPIAVTWLGGAVIGLCFITDWQVVMRRIPYVRGKFPPLEEPKPPSTEEGGEDE